MKKEPSLRLTSELKQIHGKVGPVSGDGVYDTKACYQSIAQRGAKATIPTRRNARQRRHENFSDTLAIRNATLRQIHQQGRYAWRVASGCTRQSLAENAVFRFKAIFCTQLRARQLENQKAEGLIKCHILNRMTSLGMPMSERIL